MMFSTKSFITLLTCFSIASSCPFQNIDKNVINEMIKQETRGRKLQRNGGGGNRGPGGNPGGNTATNAPTITVTTAPSLKPTNKGPTIASTNRPTLTPVSLKPTNKPTFRPSTALPTITPSLGAFCKKTNGISVPKNATGTCVAYKSILKEFQAAIPGSAFGQANLFGQAIRLAFHDSGEADITTTDFMGPDGCLSSSSDNAGLIEPTSLVFTVLEPIWQNYCNLISRADFWALAAVFAIQAAEPT